MYGMVLMPRETVCRRQVKLSCKHWKSSENLGKSFDHQRKNENSLTLSVRPFKTKFELGVDQDKSEKKSLLLHSAAQRKMSIF